MADKDFSNSSPRVRKMKTTQVEGLLAKTVESGATEAEVNSATTTAHDICAKYGLDESQFSWPDAEEVNPSLLTDGTGMSESDVPVGEEVKGPTPVLPARGAIGKFCKERLRVADSKTGYGIPYNEILAEARRRFPLAQTSYACLRWYAADMRRKNIAVPPRPEPMRVGGIKQAEERAAA